MTVPNFQARRKNTILAEESALKVLDNESSIGPTLSGMDLLAAAFDTHKDNVAIVEAIAILVNEITQYGELFSTAEIQYQFR